MVTDGPPFSVTSYDRVDDFIEATRHFRESEPVLTNVIGSVAEGVLAGREYDSCLWLDVRDADDRVVGCAVHTSPWNLAVSPMPSGAGVIVGRHAGVVAPGLPGVTGIRAVVEDVVGALTPSRTAHVTMVDVVRVLAEYTPPALPAPGSPRRAGAADRDLLRAWLVQFAIDASLPSHDVDAALDSRLDAGAMWLWEADGEPVAMAGHAPLVHGPAGAIGRVGPVYTPEHLRGRGFGAAVTDAVVRHLLPLTATIMLYADAANPTSNSVYERLGFVAVAEVVEVSLTT